MDKKNLVSLYHLLLGGFIFFTFIFLNFIYLRERVRTSAGQGQRERERERERENIPSRLHAVTMEVDAGLNPMTLGS